MFSHMTTGDKIEALVNGGIADDAYDAVDVTMGGRVFRVTVKEVKS